MTRFHIIYREPKRGLVVVSCDTEVEAEAIWLAQADLGIEAQIVRIV